MVAAGWNVKNERSQAHALIREYSGSGLMTRSSSSGFGGPEKREDVMPFLENVTRGRGVPRERLLAVAEHYDHFGGASPINSQVRDLIAALEPELASSGIALPIYWGNRNWHPMLADTMARMTSDGVKRALAIVLAAYSSYSSCRQYREDIAHARAASGEAAPQVDKVRVFYNHPEFIAANADRVREAIADCRPAPWGRLPRRVHVAQHSDVDGAELRLCAADPRNVPARGRGGGDRAGAMGFGLPEPERTSRGSRGLAPISSII